MHFDAITYSLLKDRKLRNVAPLCTVETSGWTGSQSGEVLFTGDGTTVDFSGKVSLPPVNPLNSFVLHYTIGGTTYTATADSDGNIAGTHITSGTINQDGNYEIHFDTAPDNGTDGTADYDYGIPPSNLENVLKPDPTPSGIAWLTTTGYTYKSFMITFPQPGYYLCCAQVSSWTTGGTKTYWRQIVTDPWADLGLAVNLGNYTTDIKAFLIPHWVYIDDLTRKWLLRVYISNADEWFCRIHQVRIYKIE